MSEIILKPNTLWRRVRDESITNVAAAWNSLPADLHEISDNTNVLTKRLKTVLFDHMQTLCDIRVGAPGRHVQRRLTNVSIY